LGAVFQQAEVSSRPNELPGELWEADGYRGFVQYFDLSKPIKLTEVSHDEGIGILKTLSESGTPLERGEILPLQG
jgi:hypothetical protein